MIVPAERRRRVREADRRRHYNPSIPLLDTSRAVGSLGVALLRNQSEQSAREVVDVDDRRGIGAMEQKREAATAACPPAHCSSDCPTDGIWSIHW